MGWEWDDGSRVRQERLICEVLICAFIILALWSMEHRWDNDDVIRQDRTEHELERTANQD